LTNLGQRDEPPTLGWIKTAHDLEKKEFFKILPDEITAQLSVKEGADQ